MKIKFEKEKKTNKEKAHLIISMFPYLITDQLKKDKENFIKIFLLKN